MAQAPVVTALPTASPRPHPSVRPSGRPPQHAGNGPSHAPYNVRVNLNGKDVQKILAATPSPSPAGKPSPHGDFPAPEVFSTMHTSNGN